MVICDESHRIKAAGGKASTFCSLLTSRSQKRVCMTGTPMPHGPLDLYGQFRFMDPTVFGTSFSRFRSQYARMGGFSGHEIDEYLNLDLLTLKFKSRSSEAVSADDVLELPGLHEYDRVVELEPSARRVYQEIEDRFVSDLREGTVTAANILTRLLRLSQCTGGTVRTDDGVDVPVSQAKEEALEEVMDELERDEPIVVFCRFHADLEAVHRAASHGGRQSLELSGSRNELSDWQGGQASVLAVQIQAGGVGIDLTRAHYAVYYSVNYSLGDYDQSRRRLHRPGQTHLVTYVHLAAEQTIDQDIYAALSERRDLVETVLSKHKGSS
jgi:SNF2 family DNA or RNA helicase